MKQLIEKLAPVAPVIAGALAGPAGATVASLVVSRLGLSNIDDLGEMTDQELRDTDKHLTADISQAQLAYYTQIDLANIEVNKKEAESRSLFVAGWRPACGWVVALGFAYHYIFQGLLDGLTVVLGGPENAFPNIDIGGLVTLAGVLLGATGVRMYEGLRGTKSETIRMPQLPRLWKRNKGE